MKTPQLGKPSHSAGTTVRTPYLKDGHLDLTDGHLDLPDGHLHLKDGHLDLKDGHLHLTDGHHTWRMDTLLDGWTPYLKDGHHTWRMDTLLDGWTPYLTDGHHTWRTVTLFDGWIFYFHELFICLIFSLLKEIPAFSDLYSFYCLTIIIYSFLKTKETTL